MKKISKAKIIKMITFILTIAILVCATIYMIPIMKQIGTSEGRIEFKDKIAQSGFLGVLMLFGLELAQMILAILPGEPVELLAGMCFGTIWGTIFLMISISIATSLIYFLVKKYGRDFIEEFVSKKKLDKIENSKLFKDEKKIETIMTVLFLIPATPKDLLVYVGGLLPIKTSRFLLIATLLRFPSVISSTIAGNKLLEGKWQVSILAYAVTFALTLITIFIVDKLDKSNTTQKVINSVKNKEI